VKDLSFKVMGIAANPLEVVEKILEVLRES